MERRPVFREFLREYIPELNDAVQEMLAPKPNEKTEQKPEWSVEQLNDRFARLASSIDDWPIMPDRTSHLSQHFGHLALLLSFPREIIWGAPLYHLRAMNTIAAEFKALGFPNPFESARGVRVEAEYEHVMREAAKAGPLPLPEFLFLPHNHHHHWHVNFWIPYGDEETSQERHLDHIRRAMPIWRLLGVDFEPFLRYLLNMKDDLRSARGDATELLKSIAALEKVIDKVPRTTVDAAAADRVRRDLFETLGVRAAVTASEDRWDWAARPEWPTPGSPLGTFIAATRTIGDLIRSYAQRFQGRSGNPTREEIAHWLAQLRHDEDEDERDRAVRALISRDELEDLEEDEQVDSPATTGQFEEGLVTLDANYEAANSE